MKSSRTRRIRSPITNERVESRKLSNNILCTHGADQ